MLSKIRSIFLLSLMSINLSSNAQELDEIPQGEHSGIVDFQTMCRNPAKYSPYMIYAKEIKNSLYFGASTMFFAGGLNSYASHNSIKNLSYRLIFNHNAYYFGKSSRLYFGTLGEFYRRETDLDSQNSFKYTRNNIGIHIGVEGDLGKYFSVFTELGPTVQSRDFQLSNSGTGQTSVLQGYGFGADANIGLKINIYASDDTAISIRTGMNFQMGTSQDLNGIYYVNSSYPQSININSFSYAPFVDLGYSF